MTTTRRRDLLGLAAVSTIGFWSDRPASAQAGSDKILLRGAGATFPAPLYSRWIAAFQKSSPNISISYDSVGSGEGISRFMTGSVDFGASDAVISDAQIVRVANGVKAIPATAGMVVLAYNLPGLTAPLRLSRAASAAILAGKVTSWADPLIKASNPDAQLPRRSIAVVARLDGSGTTFALTNHLNAVDSSWKSAHGVATRIDWPGNAMLLRGNEGVSGRLKQAEGSIGYVEYGFAKRLGLAMAQLENQAGKYVSPGVEAGLAALAEASIGSGDLRAVISDPKNEYAYPIVTYSWLLLYGSYGNGAKREAVRSFVRWGLSAEGQAIAREMGYLPLPDAVAAAGAGALEQIS